MTTENEMTGEDEAADEKFFINPAGRHLLTIGRDLIQNQSAAILELVKNGFDADATVVDVSVVVGPYREGLEVIVFDDGHGMSRATVTDKWLVPSTQDKKDRRSSPNDRIMQGRKGVGRYAASMLGIDLLLETVDAEGEKTTVFLIWKDFEEAKFLSDVEVIVETESSSEPPSTKLTINGDDSNISHWNRTQIKKLNFELKKLISPVSQIIGSNSDDTFNIYLSYKNIEEGVPDKNKELVESYPVFDLFDYGISGVINEDGKAELIFINQKAKNTVTEKISYDLEFPTNCGTLQLDLRVYDREADAIGQLIQRGMKDSDGNYVGKLQARTILNENNGVGVYRNGFRIRPLGDPDFDWLKLNAQRVQNPSKKIGSNQVIGYVQIESEEKSHLEENSARDGLRENIHYESLKKITNDVLELLEGRRYIYRSKAGLGRKTLKIEKEFERLFSFDELKQAINLNLKKGGVSEDVRDDVLGLLTNEEVSKNKIAEGLKNTVAIYQGQATLGKIINVVLHEGRRPLNYFKNQIPNLTYWAEEFNENPEPEVLAELLPISKGLGLNAESFVNLFSRLDPLAAKQRTSKVVFDPKTIISGASDVFENELIENKISLEVLGLEGIKFLGWKQDFYIIFTNLIDNSVFWISNKKVKDRKITISIMNESDDLITIDYRDTGPGIENHLLESGVIFDPEFSTKPEGTGLGLAIAGEAAARNGLELQAFSSETGAYFRLESKNGK